MATWTDVDRLAGRLPETVAAAGNHEGQRTWRVRDKTYAWERALRRNELEALGDAPTGPILAVRVPDVGVKEALLADDPAVYFTTPHFDGYPAVLVRLPKIAKRELAELLEEAWLTRAPKRLAKEYLAGS